MFFEQVKVFLSIRVGLGYIKLQLFYFDPLRHAPTDVFCLQRVPMFLLKLKGYISFQLGSSRLAQNSHRLCRKYRKHYFTFVYILFMITFAIVFR